MAHYNLRQHARINEGPNTILSPLKSGDSPSVDGSPDSSYGQRVFPKVSTAGIPPQDYLTPAARESSQFTHDHMAGALGLPCAPGAKESAANRHFSQAMEASMVAVHDHHAQKLGLGCAPQPAREHVPVNSPRARRTRVQEALLEADWEMLADPSEPLPEGVTWESALQHFGQLMLLDYEKRYGAMTIRPRNA